MSEQVGMPSCVSDNDILFAGKTSRLTKAQRRRIREHCLQRDGNRCMICMSEADPKALEIDHINSDATDNHANNLRLAHHVCNAREFHSKSVSMPIVCENQVAFMHTTSLEVKLNRTYEPEFRRWVFTVLLNAKKPDRYNPNKVSLRDIIASGSEFVGCSPMTARRYMIKMLSNQGMLTSYRDPSGNEIVKFNDDAYYSYSPRELEALFPKAGQRIAIKRIEEQQL